MLIKNIFYLIAVVVGLLYAQIVTATEPKQMAMTLKPYGTVVIILAGSGTVIIDWGDGSINETNSLSSYRGIVRNYAYSHEYSGTSVCTITITGENITHLECGGWGLTSLDVSKNTKLIYLACFQNQLTCLDLSGNTALKWLDCHGNQLSTDALNALFETLHSNSISGEKKICILDNNGTDLSNQEIATGKGWTVTCPAWGETTIFMVEDSPLFEGKDPQKGFLEYINSNVVYPPDAQKNGIEGNVLVQFFINQQGEVVNARIRQGIHPLLDTEALRIINSSPVWTPGKMRGKAVIVPCIYPVVFKLNQ